MGIIRKESAWSTIASYAGAALGFVNKLLLLPLFFETDEVGLINITVNTAMLVAQLAMLGYGNMVVRFFPFFKDEEKGHNGIFFLGFIYGAIGFVLISVLFFLFKNPILGHLQENSALLVDHYHLIFIIGFAFLLFNLHMVYLRSLFRTAMANFIRDVLIRILVSLSLLTYILGWVSFDQFVWVFTGANVSIALFIVLYTISIKQWNIRPNFSKIWKEHSRQIIRFSLFAILSSASYFLIQNIDSLMLAGMVDLDAVGVYSTVMYISTFMLFPSRALINITAPKVADLWKEDKLDEVEKLYQRVSFLNWVAGLFIFGGIVINLDGIFGYLKPEYAAGMLPLLLLGIARLLDMITGLNSFIVITSSRYRSDLVFMVSLVLLTIITNFFMIREWGINGAALATLISIGSINIIRVVFIWYHYKIHPFSWRMLIVMGIAVLSGLAVWWIPGVGNIYLDILIKSTVFTLIFGMSVYFSKVSQEVNDLLHTILKKIRPS